MKHLAPVAVALLGLASLAPLSADEPTLSPEELKASVLKDCKTYQSFCAAKHARIKETLRRGGEGEATQVCERLLAEEARTLKRVIWYLGIDRAQKATRETLQKVLARVEATAPPEALKTAVAGRFAAPAWLADPFNFKGEDPDTSQMKDEKPAPVISTSSGAKAPSSTNYGVAGTSAAPDIKPVAAPMAPAPPSEAPPPPPPPPGGGENPGGGGSGAGSGGGSHSSR